MAAASSTTGVVLEDGHLSHLLHSSLLRHIWSVCGHATTAKCGCFLCEAYFKVLYV
ncbi:hypothetical protein COCCADRAFT_85441 [Bipolaris zeicola 26-R-13]|uniref:Uncharacterized protein n=1 Tax=Cochliobolus carbonum (strain 26-R-13) TaxID=930089 RepID=W6YIK5_COCC2|nr:uncharacterized protein COCCADRAFT_85441 [Bipolaris zeicola 26-R-13]EUC37513.1 hypothetical protein COCCADRAFT_85441 [Bipolaris zeicola 26-R-13]